MSASRDWFYLARADLLAATVLFEQNEDLYVAVGFHLQQCMEKVIKGFLKKLKVRFSKTHDMNYLLTLLEKENQELANSLEWARELTDYAVMARYPEAILEVDLSHDRLAGLMEKTKAGHELILKAVRG